MANGKPGDHPLTDLLIHGAHPFPSDMEAMLLALHRTDPASTRDISFTDFAAWEGGQDLDAGRECLRALCIKHGIDPDAPKAIPKR